MSPYNPEKCLRIPTDTRLYVASLYLASLALLVFDSLDHDGSLLCVWSVFLALVATGAMCAVLHAHSRRVILEVMSWEHKQLGMSIDDTPLVSLVNEMT